MTKARWCTKMGKDCVNLTRLNTLQNCLKTVRSMSIEAHLWSCKLSFQSVIKVMLPVILSMILLFSMIPFEAQASSSQSKLSLYTANLSMDNKSTSSNTATLTVASGQSPALTIVKSASPTTYTTVGQTITYIYNVTNSGNVNIKGPINIIDSRINGLISIYNTDLSPGQSVLGIANYTITQADINSGSVTNSAYANNNNTNSNTATLTVTSGQSPVLTIVKSASPTTYTTVGQTITYIYNVTNSGNVNIKGPINIIDSLINGPISIPNTDLGPEQSVLGIANYTITQADINSGSVTNSAYANNNNTNSNTATLTVTSGQSPVLTIVKSASPTTYTTVGQTITYIYNVTNSGNVNIKGPINIIDSRINGLISIYNTDLSPGQSALGIANYTITQADINSGSVTNSAYANNNNTNSNTATLTVTSGQSPVLTIVKSASPTTYTTVGQTITYIYNVTNSGNVNIKGPIDIIDSLINGPISIPNTDLGPGQSVLGIANYTITQADINSGSVTNSAYANNNNTNSNTATLTVTSGQSPVLTIVKSASPTTYTTVGQTITYIYNVTNSGNVNIKGPINIIDSLINGPISIPNTNLGPGQSVLGIANYTITQADINSGSVTNSAYANNNNTNSNTATLTVTSGQSPVLTIVKSASPTTYTTVGQTITYIYNVTNSGNVNIKGPINIIDSLINGPISIPNTNLGPGQSVLGIANYTITQADINSGSVTNSAYANNNNTNSNTATLTVTSGQSPALTIVKSASPTTYTTTGQTITYIYNVTNSGNVNIKGPIDIIDSLINGPISIPNTDLGPGQSVLGIANYTITQADINSGSVTNSAYANNNNTNSNTATLTVTSGQNPALTIVKSASPTTYATTGQTITYIYNVTNSGNVNIKGPINIIDSLINGPISIPNTDLGPGQSVLGIANYTITQADINSGSVTNSAYANNNNTNSNTATLTVTAVQNPALTIVKSASPTTYTTTGQTITYIYNVTNSGNVNIKGPINIIDSLINGPISIPNTDLGPGQSITGTSNYSITQADINSGSVTNSAYANNNNTNSNTATLTVTAVQNPALTIVKSASPTNDSTTGQTITYIYNVTNSGNVNIKGPINITDSRINGSILIPNTDLGPGQSITGTSNYSITQEDINSGSVTISVYAKILMIV